MARHKRVRKIGLILAAVLAVVLFVTFTGGLVFLRATVAAIQNEPSALVIHSDRHDFGVVRHGKTYEARFQVTNVGGRRLILHQDDSDCSCLSSDPKLFLPPGASGELTATLRTAQFQGAIQSHIRYRTNDPRRPILDLVLIAQVESNPK